MARKKVIIAMFKTSLLFKFLHIALVILLTITATNAFLNITLLSKQSIMRIIDYALTLINSDISPVDSIFIARLIRQELWSVHFSVAVASFFLAIIVVILFFKQKDTEHINSMKISVVANVVPLSISFVSGIFLYYRSELHLEEELVSLLRDVHWVALYAFFLAILFHFYKILNTGDIK